MPTWRGDGDTTRRGDRTGLELARSDDHELTEPSRSSSLGFRGVFGPGDVASGDSGGDDNEYNSDDMGWD